MKIKLLGIGAAGNKAVINAVEKKVVKMEDTLLLNSTLKDIPADYRTKAVQYSNGRGAGKERDLAKELCLQSIQAGDLECLDKLVNDETELVILVASTEGGTGSGSMPIIAQYYFQVLGKPVHCVAFTGFEEDNKGLQNTIEFFQDMTDDFTIEAISNKKFLDLANNKLKAETLANDELAQRISILIGKDIIESEQNIDETDLYKVSTTPGYMTIERTSLEKVKNTDQYNKVVSDMIDNSFSLDSNDRVIKRLGVFLNVSDRTKDIVDFSQAAIKDKLGMPYEIFTHVQYDEKQEQSICIIAGGLNMPLDEVKEIYNKYQSEIEKMNTKKDNFFEALSGLKTEDTSKQKQIKQMFDFKAPVQQAPKQAEQIVKDKQDFMNNFGSKFNISINRGSQKQGQTINDAPTSGNNNHTTKLTREEYLKNNQY